MHVGKIESRRSSNELKLARVPKKVATSLLDDQFKEYLQGNKRNLAPDTYPVSVVVEEKIVVSVLNTIQEQWLPRSFKRNFLALLLSV